MNNTICYILVIGGLISGWYTITNKNITPGREFIEFLYVLILILLAVYLYK